MIAAQFLVLGAVAATIAALGAGPASILRHLYLVPALWAGLTRGGTGGGLVGLVAGLLYAPLVLPAMEREGFSSQTLDGLLSLALPMTLGWLVGRLVDESRARAARLRAVLDAQRSLGEQDPLQQRLERVAERLRTTLRAQHVGIIVAGDGETSGVESAAWGDAGAAGRAGEMSESRTARLVIASAPPGAVLDDRSAVGWTLRSGQPAWVGELRGDPRLAGSRSLALTPVRGLSLPLASGATPVGVLAIEWAGDVSRISRVAAEELALHLSLAVENARLAMRQLRFADELERKVGVATARLRELDQAKTEFLSVVSHELRTPLTALEGFSELLLSCALPPERARRCLAHLHTEAQRLGRIVAELLDVARIEAGRPLELRCETVDLNELMERNVELFAAEHGRHRFRWTPCPPAVQLRADRDALDRILKNLLSNAVKYSPSGGRISVCAGPAAGWPGMIELSVEDDGVGIPAEELPRIFDKYVRIPNPETATTRGLGLGLSLVKALAEAHGGRVEVQSLPGKGSCFRLLLPVSKRDF